MRTGMGVPVVFALSSFSMLGGCKKETPPPPETTAAAPSRVGEAGGVVALRRETSELFDNARTAFLKRDTAAAAKALRDAAALVKAEADSAARGARVGLSAAASGLESVAARIDKNAVKAVKTIDLAFARTHQAEAQNHLLLAKAAWVANKTSAASSELTQAADHFEHAVTSAGETLDAASGKTVADTRALADQLAKGDAVVPRTFDATTKALGSAISTFGSKLARQKA